MFSIFRSAPRGPSFAKKTFRGVVTRCMKYENGTRATNASESTAWNSHTERWTPRSAPSDVPSASSACPRAHPTGDHGPHAGRTTARRHASSTKPETLITNSSASAAAKRAVGSKRSGRATNRRQTAIPRPITKKRPKRSSVVS